MKRVWIFVGTGILLLLLVAWLYSQYEWLTNELLAQIKLGMKKEQVEALLGNPVDGYTVNMALGPITYPMQISLVAPSDSWLTTYEGVGKFIRLEATNDESRCGRQLIWLGRARALVLFLNDSGEVCQIQAFRINKTGGGFFSWLGFKLGFWQVRQYSL
jgi:hypothetical protein